jgi:putative ubiquitin-RnfH superfamily antitoxin RatB of RatAB toxin-antitoxin module
MPMAEAGGVEVIYAEAGRAWRLRLPATERLTAGDVLASLREHAPSWPEAAHAPVAMAVFGREVGRETVLRAGDRLELLRALPTDPKLARRARAGAGKPG